MTVVHPFYSDYMVPRFGLLLLAGAWPQVSAVQAAPIATLAGSRIAVFGGPTSSSLELGRGVIYFAQVSNPAVAR